MSHAGKGGLVVVAGRQHAVSGEFFVVVHALSGVLFVNIIVIIVYWNIVVRYYVFRGCFFLSA